MLITLGSAGAGVKRVFVMPVFGHRMNPVQAPGAPVETATEVSNTATHEAAEAAEATLLGPLVWVMLGSRGPAPHLAALSSLANAPR